MVTAIGKDPQWKSKVKVDLVQKTAIADDFTLNDFKGLFKILGVPAKLAESPAAEDIMSIPVKLLLLKFTEEKKKSLEILLDNAPIGTFIQPVVTLLANMKVRSQALTIMLVHPNLDILYWPSHASHAATNLNVSLGARLWC